MLAAFHDEWDAAALEAHALRRDLGEARTQLSQALYQHDAACRVISRLLRERDEAREALAEAQRTGGASGAGGGGERKRAAPTAAEAGVNLSSGGAGARAADHPAEKRAKAGLTSDVLEALAACNKRLSKSRKKRPLPEGLAAPEALGAFTLESKFPVHQTSKQGILGLALLPGGAVEGADLVASGGVDTKVNISAARGKRVQSLAGHKKKVLDVAFIGDRSRGAATLLASGSADATCKVWRRAAEGGADFSLVSTFRDHSADVTAVCPHPTESYLATASADGTWGFYDLEAELCLTQMGAGEGGAGQGFTCAAFHPDGLIWGAGTAGPDVQVWDVKSQKKAAEFACSAGPITALSFSENGYYLATAAAGEAKVWDLRKLKCVQTLELPYAADVAPGLAFDHSGAYLGVCGSDTRVYGTKQGWECLVTFPDKIPTKKGAAPRVHFGPNAQYLAVAAGDHNLRYFAAPA